MRIVAVIAAQVVGDAVHERAIHLVGVYTVAVALLAPLAADLALGAPRRAALDTGLTLMWLTVSAVAIWQGVRAVGVDLASGRAALLLVRPIGRPTWVTGRVLGATIVVGLVTLSLLLAWIGLGLLLGIPPTRAWVGMAVLLAAEGAVLVGVSALLSTLARPALAGACATGLWVAGHLAREYGDALAGTAAAGLVPLLFALIPDLDVFNVHAAVVHGDGVALQTVALALAYAAAWTVGVGALTVVAVSGRDIA